MSMSSLARHVAPLFAAAIIVLSACASGRNVRPEDSAQGTYFLDRSEFVRSNTMLADESGPPLRGRDASEHAQATRAFYQRISDGGLGFLRLGPCGAAESDLAMLVDSAGVCWRGTWRRVGDLVEVYVVHDGALEPDGGFRFQYRAGQLRLLGWTHQGFAADGPGYDMVLRRTR